MAPPAGARGPWNRRQPGRHRAVKHARSRPARPLKQTPEPIRNPEDQTPRKDGNP
jgi:hypothetical protein